MTSAIVGILTILCVSSAMAAPQANRPKQDPPAKQTAMTGCIDEQEGRYILIHDQTRALIANLEAEGFPTEGFAKHLGQKVTVRGTVATTDPKPVLKVRTIETVSDMCGQQQ